MEKKTEQCNLSVMQYNEEKQCMNAEHETEKKDEMKVDYDLILLELWKQKKTDKQLEQLFDLFLVKRSIEKYEMKHQILALLDESNTTQSKVLAAWKLIESQGLEVVDEESMAVAMANYLIELSPEARRELVKALECIKDLST